MEQKNPWELDWSRTKIDTGAATAAANDGGMSQDERIQLQASGAPILRADRDPYRFIKDQKTRDKTRSSMTNNAAKELSKSSMALSKLDKSDQDLADFEVRNERLKPSGTVAGKVYNWFAGWGGNSDVSRMNAISQDQARQQRQPGEGAASDFEGRIYQKVVGGPDKPYGANVGYVRAQKAWNEVQRARQGFRESFVATNGTMLGADAMWQQYRRENPIFQAGKVDAYGNPVLNPARKNWSSWMSGKANNYLNRGKTPQAPARPQGKSGGVPVYDINGKRVQ